MDYLKLFRGGDLKLFVKDDEKIKTYNYHKKGDKWRVINRITKETVAVVDMEEDAIGYRLSEHPIENITTCLRRGIHLEEGVTIGDFLQMIQNYDYLDYFVSANFPLYNGVYNSLNPDLLSIRRIAVVENGVFDIYPTFDMGVGEDHTPDAVISIDREMDFYIEDKKVWTGERHLCLIDLIEIMFSRWKSEDVVQLTKDGLFCNGEQVEDLIGKFYTPVEVDDGLTLRDLFSFVRDNEDLKAFIAGYSWCGAIDEFHKEMDKPIKKGEETSCEYAVVQHDCEMQKLGKYGNTFDWNSDFVGIGPLSEHSRKFYEERPDGLPIPETERYGLSYIGINAIAHLPLNVETTIDIRKNPYYGRSGGQKEEGIEYGKFKYKVSFGELLDVIYDDISFHGGPEDRDEVWSDLKETSDKIKEGLEETKPFDDFLEEMEKERKEEFGDEYESDLDE